MNEDVLQEGVSNAKSLVSKNITYLRKKYDLSKIQLSLKTGINIGSIQAMEKGNSMTLENLYRISRCFGVTIELLIKEEMGKE